MKFSILFIALFLVQGLLAQIALQQWRDHLPYSQTLAVAAAKDKIFCATPSSLFYYDAADDQLKRLNTINGLSEVNITAINFDEQSGYLVVAYENANIDLIHDNQIYNISDIKRKSMVGSKRINRISFHQQLAYLSCDFGIVVLDPIRKEIKETYQMGSGSKILSIYETVFTDTSIIAATSAGLYSANFDAGNLNDFNSWHRDNTLPKPTATYNDVAVHSSGIYANIPGVAYGTDTMMVKQNGQWQPFTELGNEPLHQIKTYGDTLLFVMEYSFKYFYNNMQSSFLAYTYGDKGPMPADVSFDAKGWAWIADKKEGLVKSKVQWQYQFCMPNGPAFKNSFSITSSNGGIWVASGGVQTNWDAAYVNKGIYHFSDQKWSSYNASNTDVFDTISDVVYVYTSPFDASEVYVSSWGKGLIRLKNYQVNTIYNTTNSSLSNSTFYPGFLAVGGLCMDDEKNLWVANGFNPYGLSYRKPNGTWKSFNLSPYVTDQPLNGLLIDDWGQKWVVIARGGGILVYDDNGTPDNTADDHKTKITSAVNQGHLPSMGVNSIAKDKEGGIWIGTDKGVAVIYSPENVFSGYNYDAQQIYVEQDGITQYLLESEVVTAVVIDGANRKWFGTRNSGVFLMSENGATLVHHFDRSNSPLLSNNIYSIAIEHESGEVFFGTENGIISYRGTATQGAEAQVEKLNIFPNPVKPDFNGLIAIKPLVDQADVKITDLDGNLVHQTTALGGQAVWNGNNLHGERVASGVYLVMVTDAEGKQTAMGKILILK